MPDITSSGLKVLVVDDSQTIRRSAELFLKQGDLHRKRRLGHVASLGRAAEVAFLGEGDEHFQLVDHVSDAAVIPHLSARPRTLSCVGMRRFIPFVPKPAMVPVIRLQGAIGMGTRGLNDATTAPLIERAFARGKPAAVALVVGSLVAMALSAFGLKPADVLAELERREGLSGLDEFALRKVRDRDEQEGKAP